MPPEPTTVRGGAGRASLALLVLLASGCAAVGPVDPGGPGADAAPGVSVGAGGALDRVGSADVGAVVELPPGTALGVERVRVIDEYAAASGRRCRNVARPNDPTPWLVCRRADGHWSATRPLVGDASFVR